MKRNQLIRSCIMYTVSLWMIPGVAFAQAKENVTTIDHIFIIGEYQDQYDELSHRYPQSLLEACDYNMDKAYGLWLNMLKVMEEEAQKVDVDLQGVQLYLKVYWGADGKIEYLGYYPKGKSKLIADNELSAFFKLFMEKYTFPEEFHTNFNHNASAKFPTTLLPENSGD